MPDEHGLVMMINWQQFSFGSQPLTKPLLLLLLLLRHLLHSSLTASLSRNNMTPGCFQESEQMTRQFFHCITNLCRTPYKTVEQ
jgi:hypothetical protein